MIGRTHSANFFVAFVARTLTVSSVRLESSLLDASNFIRMRASGTQRGRRGGFTLIEIVIVLAILSTIIFTSFSAFRNAKVLDTATEDVLTLISTARGETLSAKANTQYGVHITSGSMTLYAGATYSAGDSANQVVDLDSALEIVSIALSGGGSDILFDRLTGKTSNSGTFVIRVKSDTAKTHTVTIAGTGIASFN